MRKKQPKPYVVGYVRHLPRIPAQTQAAALEPVCDRIVIEGKRDDQLVGSLALLTETLLRDTTLAVYRLLVLADPKSRRRQHSLDAAMDAIADRGTDAHPVVIWEVSTGLRTDHWRSRDKMVRAARDDIARVSRTDTAGRHAHEYSDEQLHVLRKHWLPGVHPTRKAARDAIRAEAKIKKIPRIGGLSVEMIAHVLRKAARQINKAK